MMDIVGFMLTQPPVNTWTSTKKLALLDRFCKARGYQETIGVDENGEAIPNPMSKRDFVNTDILNYIKTMFESDSRTEAVASLSYETVTF